MAHELEILSDGTASMAYVGEVPWHGLGVQVSNDMTPSEMMKAANLDWKVEKVPTFAVMPDGEKISTGSYAIVRETDHKVLSPSVGPAWEPVDNEKCFEFFNDFVKSGDMEMHTAGSLRGGQIIWALAKIRDKFTLFGGDEIEGNLLLSASHLYGKVSNTDFTPTRVVCMNTLMMALGSQSKNAVSVNHRTKFDPEVVKTMMGIASFKLHDYEQAALVLGQKSYTGADLSTYFKGIFPLKNDKDGISQNAEKCFEALEDQPGGEFAAGTWWQAYNAVTYVTDHLLSRSADTRVFSSWFGVNRGKKLEAFKTATKFATA